MIREYLDAIVIDSNKSNLAFFRKIFDDVKIKTKAVFFSDQNEIAGYMMNGEIVAPEILFINYDYYMNNSWNIIDELKDDFGLYQMTIVMYSEWLSDQEIEEMFVKGVNVFMKKPGNYDNLKKSVSDIITVNWQYYTSGLNKDNFIMKV